MPHAPGQAVCSQVFLFRDVFTGHTDGVVQTLLYLHLPVMASSDWNQVSNDSNTPGFRKQKHGVGVEGAGAGTRGVRVLV